MSKIKLSILLLISFFVFSCSNNQFNNSNQKYSLAYIGGEYDGLLLKNYLMGSLKSLDMYDQNSNFEIKSSINHGSDLFITNIDNTSDREKINTNLSIKIINKKSNCVVYDYEINVSQFYIYASSEKFLSNRVAVKKIKKDNTESTVRQFINKLKKIGSQCYE
jgi:hypothetical protein